MAASDVEKVLERLDVLQTYLDMRLHEVERRTADHSNRIRCLEDVTKDIAPSGVVFRVGAFSLRVGIDGWAR